MRLFPRAVSIATVVLLTTAGLATGPAATADAAAKPSVTITKIKNRTAPYRKSVTVEVPAVTRTGNVELGSASFTIKKGKKTVAKHQTSAKLKAGTYKVTTTAKYRTWKVVTKTRVEQQTVVVVPAYTSVAAECTVTDAVASETPTYTVVLDCTSTSFAGTQTLYGTAEHDDTTGWSVKADHSDDPAVIVDDLAVIGAVFSPHIYFVQDLTEVQEVTVPYEVTEWSDKTKTRTQSLKIKQGKKPGRTDPISEYKCPSWAPIKGNAQSMIYHLPSQRFYKVTKPEDCFSTQAAARHAGYRKSKV